MQWILIFWSPSGEDLLPQKNVGQGRKNKSKSFGCALIL